MGDVAMAVPVMAALLQQYKDVELSLVSDKKFEAFVKDIPRLHFIPADLKGKHKGIKGLYQLFSSLNIKKYSAIADLHNVIRTKIIRSFLLFSRKPIAVIDKGRKEKKALARQKNKHLFQLKTSFERYAQVFEKLGYPVAIDQQFFLPKTMIPSEIENYKKEGKKIIGIAPFARYHEKTYPVELMKEVVKELNKEINIKIIFFGGGEKELSILKQWEQEFNNTLVIAGKLSLHDELKWISSLHLMISMDSANMHLASMFQVPVISIWGATHPFAGFLGWQQQSSLVVQEDIRCRPCSVFGNKPCYRGDLICMHSIRPAIILEKTRQVLHG